MLKQSYAKLLEEGHSSWNAEVPGWERFDDEVFRYPDTIGACTFLSWYNGHLVGFGSYDTRQRPEYGIVAHNCILPEFQRLGLGKKQLVEILCRFQSIGIRYAKVSTSDHPFFVPAQRMYVSCGFQEVGRSPWPNDPSWQVMEYGMALTGKAW